jgi:hypothetical protein
MTTRPPCRDRRELLTSTTGSFVSFQRASRLITLFVQFLRLPRNEFERCKETPLTNSFLGVYESHGAIPTSGSVLPDQAAGELLRRQTERSLAWSKTYGHILDDFLRLDDKGVSAWKGDNSTSGKLGAFIRECDAGRVTKGSILIVESLDRQSRDNGLHHRSKVRREIVNTPLQHHFTLCKADFTSCRRFDLKAV